MANEIVEQYIVGTLKPQTAGFGAPDATSETIAATVREQMLSFISHWNDEPFRKTLLLIGEEEGLFYRPKAHPDIRKFIVVTLRNSPLESIHADSYPGRKLTPNDIKTVTSAAIEYFRNMDFPAMADTTGPTENDLYGSLAKKYPVAWKALTQLANSDDQVIRYSPLPILSKPGLDHMTVQNAVSDEFYDGGSAQLTKATADGYTPTVDPGLMNTLRTVTEQKIPFVVDGFKSITRNIEKLLAIMEYILGNGRGIIFSNYLLANGHAERRLKPVKPASGLPGMRQNWMNGTGLSEKHKQYLRFTAENS